MAGKDGNLTLIAEVAVCVRAGETVCKAGFLLYSTHRHSLSMATGTLDEPAVQEAGRFYVDALFVL